MARGKKQIRTIQVKPAPTKTNIVMNLVDLSDVTNSNTLKQEDIQKMMKLSPKLTESTRDITDVDESLTTSNETAVDYISTMKQIAPRQDDEHYRIDEAFIEVLLKTEGMADNVAEILNPELMIVGKKVEERQTEECEKKMKKKRNGKKKKKSKKEINIVQPDTENVENIIDNKKPPVKLEPIVRKHEETFNMKDNSVTKIKPVGCFGFVSTWLAKRKEKRREKKRKAIKSRNQGSVEQLVEYEHKTSKGGVAFTIEIDSRPIMKTVLPPIKQKPGPIRLAMENKLEMAENKRIEQINKKRDIARTQTRLVQQVADRRAQNENNFKQATLQKIKVKEHRASRGTSRLNYTRNEQCKSRMKSRLDILTSKWESVVATPLEEFITMSPVPSDDDYFSDCTMEYDVYYNDNSTYHFD